MPARLDMEILDYLDAIADGPQPTRTARQLRAILRADATDDAALRCALKRLRDRSLVRVERPPLGAFGEWKERGGVAYRITENGRTDVAERRLLGGES